jgi:manganese/zinc/iron transport system permease protein
MHYLLMVLVAATTVAAFEAVGSILVVAMLIVPAATAYLLTNRLGPMIILAQIIAAVCGVLGHLSAVTVPGIFDLGSINTAGSMATIAGLLFLVVMCLAPHHGIVARLRHRSRIEAPA